MTLSTNRNGPDAVVQRVESLAQCFEEMSVQRPAHKVTEARLEEWRKQLRRLSQQKVTQADSQTINQCHPHLERAGALPGGQGP